jgi:hypothetical protein
MICAVYASGMEEWFVQVMGEWVKMEKIVSHVRVR